MWSYYCYYYYYYYYHYTYHQHPPWILYMTCCEGCFVATPYHESFTWRVTWVVSWLPPPPWILYMTCYVGCFVATPSTMNPWHDLLRGLFRGYPLWTHIEADLWLNVSLIIYNLETSPMFLWHVWNKTRGFPWLSGCMGQCSKGPNGMFSVAW